MAPVPTKLPEPITVGGNATSRVTALFADFIGIFPITA
jgi:hypothetical protein